MHLVCSIFFSTATNHFTVLVTHIVSTNNAVANSLSCLQISWSRYLASASDPGPTPVPLDHLADRLPFLQSQEIVDSTHHSYQAGIWRYSNFCGSRGWQSFLAIEITLRFAFLADQVSYKTIKLYMAGLLFIHTKNSLPDPFSSAPLLHFLLLGIKCTMGLLSCQRFPVTMSLLRQIKEDLSHASDFWPSDKLMLWSAFTLAFHCFLTFSITIKSPSASLHH